MKPITDFRQYARASIFCAMALVIPNTLVAQVSPKYQDAYLERFTIDDGLPFNSIWNLFSDRTGFLWLGSGNALLKYDGYAFEEINELLPWGNSFGAFGAYERADGDLWIPSSGIDVQREINQINVDLIDTIPFPIRIGIGLHFGKLIMGIIGDSERNSTAIVADTVNTASRMEGLTKYYRANIIISEKNMDALENEEAFKLRHLEKVQVKGKSIALRIFECFDNDSTELITEKMRHMPQFEQALDHFYREEFAEAIQMFDLIVKANPDDNVVKKFRNETAQLIQQEVPEDWTGVTKLDFK